MSRKAPADPNGRHIRVYCTLLNTHAWRVLGWPARALFVDLRSAVNGTNNGNVAATLSTLKHRGWNSSETLATAIYQLRAMGFLAVTREGGLRQGGRVPTLYRFTDLEVFEQPKVGVQAIKATHDYKRFVVLVDAEKTLREEVERLRRAGQAKQLTKKSPVRETNCTGSVNELDTRFSSSVNEQGRADPVRKTNRGNRASIAPRAA